MASPMNVVAEPWDVNRRLAELGLEERLLTEAVARGFAAWANCTPNHPFIYGGFASWGESVCALAENLAPLGWIKVEETGQPLVINSQGVLAITVASGDENTGRPELIQPSTASSKGPRTVEAIERNGWLFVEMELDAKEKIKSNPNRDTWILLTYRDVDQREVRCELSRPVSLDPDRRVNKWSERIILSATPFDGYSRQTVLGGDSGPKTGEITVEIKRRA